MKLNKYILRIVVRKLLKLFNFFKKFNQLWDRLMRKISKTASIILINWIN